MKRRLLLILLALLMLLQSLPAAAATPSDYDINHPENLQADYLYGKACAAFDADTGRVLFSKNADSVVYPASTTKILTLLLALESDIPLDQKVIIPAEAANVPKDSSVVPVTPGEEMTFQDLLYGFHLKSGNDAGVAIAILVSGTESAFVKMMNDRAAELGCTSTHFANPHGYHSDSHYTTVNDMAKIAMEALKNETFREIVSTSVYNMGPTNYRENRVVQNGYALMDTTSVYYREDCIGVKSGYTKKAGNCFVGAGERSGLTILTLSMNASGGEYRWIDTIRLLKYGYLQYDFMSLESFLPALSATYSSLTIENAANNDPGSGVLSLELKQLNDVEYEIPVYKDSESYYSTLNDLRGNTSVEWKDDLRAPIEAGEVLGTLTVSIDEETYVSASLVATRDVAARPEPLALKDIFPFLAVFDLLAVRIVLIIVLVLILLLIFLNMRRKAIARRRKRELYERRKREYERRRQMQRRQAQTHTRGPQPGRRPEQPVRRPRR